MTYLIRNKFFQLTLLFFSIALFSQCKSSKKEEQKNVGQGKQIMTVSGIVLQARKLDNIVRTTGTLRAFDEVELHAETSGRITKIYFIEGSHVNKGDLLVKINDEDLRAQFNKIELQIKLNEAQVNRQNELLKISATSQQEFDIAENQLNSLRADKEALNAAIKKTEIHAPFNGVIGLRYVSEGSYVSPASQIASIQNINPVKIDFSIPEKYSAVVNKNDVVNFYIEETEQQFTGRVYAIEPKIDLSTRSLQVRALCDNKTEKIIPGSFARIELSLKEINNALMVPTQAIIPVLKGQTVFVARDGMAESVPVKTGLRTESEVQVTEGLQTGDTVITTGMNSLKPKTLVSVDVK